MQLNQNGIIMQRKIKDIYQGIEGDNWYLNYESENEYFENYYDQFIDMTWKSEDYVECCTNFDYIHRYIQESKALNIPYRVLFCQTEKKAPQLEDINNLGYIELGYDYAYSGGSFYSCIANDIIPGRISEFNNITLNKYALLDTLEQVNNFIKLRSKLINEYDKVYFEKGNFTIYKIFEITTL